MARPRQQLTQREYAKSIIANTVRALRDLRPDEWEELRHRLPEATMGVLTSVLGDQPTSRGFGGKREEEPMAVKPAKKKRVFDDDEDEDERPAPKGKLKVKTLSHRDADSMKESAKQQPSIRLTFKEGEARTVRFLHEPFDRKNPWVEYHEHSLQGAGGQWYYVPCIEGCKLDGDVRAAKRWMVCVWDRDSKAPKLLKCTGAMVENLIIKYEKRGTLLDRDYSITRTGEGTDTKYHIEPEDKEKFDQRNVKLIDIEDYLDAQAQNYYGGAKGLKARASSIDDDEDDDDDDVEDEDEEETPKKKAKARRVVDEDEDDDEDEDEDEEPVKKKRKVVDEDEDDEDEDEDEDETPKRKATAKRRVVEDDDEDEDEDEDEEDEAPRRKTAKASGSSSKAATKRPLGKRR